MVVDLSVVHGPKDRALAEGWGVYALGDKACAGQHAPAPRGDGPHRGHAGDIGLRRQAGTSQLLPSIPMRGYPCRRAVERTLNPGLVLHDRDTAAAKAVLRLENDRVAPFGDCGSDLGQRGDAARGRGAKTQPRRQIHQSRAAAGDSVPPRRAERPLEQLPQERARLRAHRNAPRLHRAAIVEWNDQVIGRTRRNGLEPPRQKPCGNADTELARQEISRARAARGRAIGSRPGQDMAHHAVAGHVENQPLGPHEIIGRDKQQPRYGPHERIDSSCLLASGIEARPRMVGAGAASGRDAVSARCRAMRGAVKSTPQTKRSSGPKLLAAAAPTK